MQLLEERLQLKTNPLLINHLSRQVLVARLIKLMNHGPLMCPRARETVEEAMEQPLVGSSTTVSTISFNKPKRSIHQPRQLYQTLNLTIQALHSNFSSYRATKTKPNLPCPLAKLPDKRKEKILMMLMRNSAIRRIERAEEKSYPLYFLIAEISKKSQC